MATASATASAALRYLIYTTTTETKDHRPAKRRKMVGRPRKHLSAEDAANAKLASDRARYLRRKEGNGPQGIQFIMYEPTQTDAPSSTSNATGLRSDIDNLPREEDDTPLVQQAILVSRGRPEVPLPLPVPLPSPQQEEQEVEDSINQLNLQDEVDAEYEAVIALQVLQSGQESRVLTGKLTLSRGMDSPRNYIAMSEILTCDFPYRDDYDHHCHCHSGYQ
ncbi:MAG TPA: hypothetical protein VGU46_00400 [Acidobacteriaceae bacterium]|nr:hypothetical protein [Acidobacteriaceae bacterium]